jgi:uncharacterized protein YbbC (DUF1343 family)
MRPAVVPGVDVLLRTRSDLLVGKRVGLVCNASSITSDFRHVADALAADPRINLVQLFGPEHGIRGDAQDMIPVRGGALDRITGLPVWSLYGPVESSLWPPDDLVSKLDVVVFDIQDVGARYYTYAYTMAHMMEVAGRVGVPVVVLDRPNPIDGVSVEGNIVHPGFRSFVGRYALANRHGMTVGELAGFFQGEEGIRCQVEVVRCEGWDRRAGFGATGLPWVLPSPNMPTPDTALVYPGGCFFEGTMLSEGRGQTRPFEIVGAPWVDGHRWAAAATDELRASGYSGFHLRPLVFQPTFHKHVGATCGGVQIHVTARDLFRPVMVSVALLKAAWRLWPREARWRTAPYEFVADPLAIDLLGGSSDLRHEIEQDVPLADIQARWDAESAGFRSARVRYLLYEQPGGGAPTRRSAPTPPAAPPEDPVAEQPLHGARPLATASQPATLGVGDGLGGDPARNQEATPKPAQQKVRRSRGQRAAGRGVGNAKK